MNNIAYGKIQHHKMKSHGRALLILGYFGTNSYYHDLRRRLMLRKVTSKGPSKEKFQYVCML